MPDHAPGRQQPGYRHIDGIQYSLNLLGYDHNGITMMIDADMFLIRPFSALEYMKNYDFIGGYQYRSKGSVKVVYTSPCLVFMDMTKLSDKQTITFEGGHIKGLACDVGGQTYYYFQNNPDIKLKLYLAVSKDGLPNNEQELRDMGYDENSINLILNEKREYAFQFHGDTHFLHYYAGGSNWPKYNQAFLKQKDQIVNHYIDQQIAAYANN